jgi:hypothetical protein
MQQTLEVTKQNAIQAYNEADSKGKELLENLYGKEVFNQKITDRVKSFEDALELYSKKIEPVLSNLLNYTGYNKEVISAQATEKLKIIISVLNEDWTPDWDNSNQYKYYPYFDMSNNTLVFSHCFSWHTYSYVSSRLCLRSKELAEYCGKQFIDLYKQSFLML